MRVSVLGKGGEEGDEMSEEVKEGRSEGVKE